MGTRTVVSFWCDAGCVSSEVFWLGGDGEGATSEVSFWCDVGGVSSEAFLLGGDGEERGWWYLSFWCDVGSDYGVIGGERTKSV